VYEEGGLGLTCNETTTVEALEQIFCAFCNGTPVAAPFYGSDSLLSSAASSLKEIVARDDWATPEPFRRTSD